MNHWGYHLLLDCGGCELDAITNPKILTAWVKELVERIEMVPYGEPQVIHFGAVRVYPLYPQQSESYPHKMWTKQG